MVKQIISIMFVWKVNHYKSVIWKSQLLRNQIFKGKVDQRANLKVEPGTHIPSNSRNNKKAGETKQKAPFFLFSKL